MIYFDEKGRRISGLGMRVFSNKPSFYYRLNQPEIFYEKILGNLQEQNFVSESVSHHHFEEKSKSILDILQRSSEYANLLKGVHIPFAYHQPMDVDLGTDLENTLLLGIQKSFNKRFPDSHFKAVLQSNSKLPTQVSLDPLSRYNTFIEESRKGTVVGWYFPQAVQEFDIKSQRQQMGNLPDLQGVKICLSGGKDICAALVGSPDILINEDFYPPILCMSAYVHADPRLVMLIKGYGPHMEFWCMSQMLTKETTQVSEQWSGGITVFDGME